MPLSPGNQVPLDRLQALHAIATPHRRKKENAWAGSPEKSVEQPQLKRPKGKHAIGSTLKLQSLLESSGAEAVLYQWENLKQADQPAVLEQQAVENNPLFGFACIKTPGKSLPKTTLLSLVDTALADQHANSIKRPFPQVFLDSLRRNYITDAAVSELMTGFLKSLRLLYMRRDPHGVFVSRLLRLYHPDPISTATSGLVALVHSVIACPDSLYSNCWGNLLLDRSA